MSRKSIIISLIALAVMLLGVGVAVLCLYSDVELPSVSERHRVSDDDRHAVLSAIPSDAALVACFKDSRKVVPELLDGMECPEQMKKSSMAVSLHYSGKLLPLYVFDADEEESAGTLAAALRDRGMIVETYSPGLLIASESETLVKSSIRHLDKNVSVMDASGFDKALSAVSDDDALFVSHAHAGRLIPAVMARGYHGKSDFISRFCDWTAFGLNHGEGGLDMKGTVVYDNDATEFMTVLSKSASSSSSVASVLPSYTLFALSLPMRDHEPYISAYQSYLDTKQKLQSNLAERRALEKKYGISPEDLMTGLDVREVAAASFMMGNRMEKISLIKVGNRDVKSADPAISYPEMTSVLFGDMFSCVGEASFYADGWIISGSKAAVEEYRSGKAVGYTLKRYMEDAGLSDFLSGKSSAAVGYFSFTEEPDQLRNIFASSFLKLIRGLYDQVEIAPAVFSVSQGKEGMTMQLGVGKLALSRTEEALFERDTVVVVPKGPFKVKNSGTGKMNEFYQNTNLAICLREDGKDLWGVPFDKPLCGTAQTVDFFANGKLQIIFGAGSRIYLIDRLGRYVNGFPLDLKKEILIGPDVYDFTGKRKYNIMVLHKDNTIEMYNLQGAKPASWKGISVKEGTIKSLPERIDLSGSTFWIVRTSVQTLIYPLYGGDPLTVFEGNGRIRPDSEIKATDGRTVEFTCYDGKVRTHALK